MGRRRTNDSSAPKKRTRTGCANCRLKKVKCDEARPVCTRCKERRLPCHVQVQLKWEDEFALRGLTFGRQGVWGKPGSAATEQIPTSMDGPCTTWCLVPPVEPHQFVHTSMEDVADAVLPQNPVRTRRGQMDSAPIAFFSNDVELVQQVLPSRGFHDSDQYSTPSMSGGPMQVDYLRKTAQLHRIQQGDSTNSPQVTNISSHYFAIPPQPALSPFPDSNAKDTFELLAYYMQKFCPLTTASSTHDSPFSSVLLPFAVSSSQLVMNSILAVAACLRSQSEPLWKPKALRHKQRILEGLRNSLTVTSLSQALASPETLIVMLMLCMFEIVSRCDEGWVVHLSGARDLIGLRRQHGHFKSTNVVELFAERFFAFQDVIGRTACGEAPKFGSDYWDDTMQEVDSWMGCSPQLARILSTITDLSRMRQNTPSISSQDWFVVKATQLEEDLDSLEQIVSNPEETMLTRCAELKRLSAIVYLHCALNHASPSTPLVKEHVQKILNLLAFFMDRHEMAGMTWPIFVAAVELDPFDDTLTIEHPEPQVVNGRRYLLNALNSLMDTAVTNAARTREVVVKVWNARDLAIADSNWIQDHRNDWERYVSPYSGNLSLA